MNSNLYYLMTEIEIFINQYNAFDMKWGSYKIIINNTYYTNYDDIPHLVYQTFQNVTDYEIFSMDTDNELRGFIIHRLFDKYFNNDPVIQINSIADIHKLYNDNEFILQFMNFLRNQIIVDTISRIENNIVNASRPNLIINEWGNPERAGTPTLLGNSIIRINNRNFITDLDDMIKILWNALVMKAQTIMEL